MSITKEVSIKKISIGSSSEDTKYTDQFFKFPITMYLTEDVENSDKLSDLGIAGVHSEPDGVVGTVRCSIEDIVIWYDSFSKPRTLEDVEKKGFDMTHVELRNGGEFTCLWNRSRFERELNLHVKKLNDMLLDQTSAEFEKALKEMLENKENNKLPWYKRWFKK